MAKSIGSTKTAGSRTRNVPTPSQTPRPKTSPQASSETFRQGNRA